MPVGMPAPPSTEVDPFTDDQFAPLDTSDGPKHIAALGRIAEEHPELQAGLVPEGTEPQPTPTSIPLVDEPEVIEVEGGTITISHDTKGWHGVLEQEDGGGKETFHGKTQKELMANVLQGKLKATAQIRKLNKKLKLGTPVAVPETVVQPAVYQSKQLTANDIFEIKTELANDPDKAFESWFQKKFGMSATQLVAIAQEANNRSRKGEEAYEELGIEGVSKEFLEKHPDYYPHVDNGQNIMTWLCRNKLGRQVTQNDNFGTISGELLRRGLYTVENLDEALEELEDSGLLIPPPEAEVPAPVPTPAVPPVPATREQPPAPTNPRIASETRRPRGSLGIRPGSVSTVPTEEERVPSADELENLSSKEISELLARTRTYALNQKGYIRR